MLPLSRSGILPGRSMVSAELGSDFSPVENFHSPSRLILLMGLAGEAPYAWGKTNIAEIRSAAAIFRVIIISGKLMFKGKHIFRNLPSGLQTTLPECQA